MSLSQISSSIRNHLSANQFYPESKKCTRRQNKGYLYAKTLAGRHWILCKIEKQEIAEILKKLDFPVKVNSILSSLHEWTQNLCLRLLNTDLDSLELLENFAPELVKLDLGLLGIELIPRELTCRLSSNLNEIILRNNKITTSSLVFAQQYMDEGLNSWVKFVHTLDLSGNRLSANIPVKILSYMPHLQVILAERNSFSSLTGINNARQLKTIVFDLNSLVNVSRDLYSLSHLKQIYFSRNEINQPLLGSGLRLLTYLQLLDLSHNRLNSLPGDLFQLPYLEIVRASHNHIANLPQVQPRVSKSKSKISFVDISHNFIIKFPESLLLVCDFLDLSNNKLRLLPTIFLRKVTTIMRLKRKIASELYNIDLRGNPMIWPPVNVVEQGLDAIMTFYLEACVDAKALMGIKCIFVGSERSGKSSLALSLVDGQSRLTADDGSESSSLFESREVHYDLDPNLIKIQQSLKKKNNEENIKLDETEKEDENESEDGLPKGKSIVINIYDFSCKPHEEFFNGPFYTLPFILGLTVDLSLFIDEKNTDDLFNKHVAPFINNFIQKNNQIILILIGTKCDLIPNKEKAYRILQNIQICISDYLKSRIKQLAEEVYKIEALPNISASLAGQYKQLAELHRTWQVNLNPQPILTSSAWETVEFIEMQNILCNSLTTLALEAPKVAPFCLSLVPSSWSELEAYCEELASGPNSDVDVIWTFKRFSNMLINRFRIPSNDIHAVATFLSDSGKIIIPHAMIWDPENSLKHLENSRKSRPLLEKVVILMPNSLLEALKLLLNPNLLDFLDNKLQSRHQNFVDEILKRMHAATGLSAKRRLDQCKAALVAGDGVFLGEIWAAIMEFSKIKVLGPHLSIGRLIVVLLWRWFEIAYPVAEYKSPLKFYPIEGKMTLVS